MPLEPMPAADIEIDERLVRRLLQEQHPDLAGLALVAAGSGWDNALYRVGDALAVRLPRRTAAASLIEREQRWLPALAARLPLPVPLAIRIGRPGQGYPWRWSVVPWLPGESAALAHPHDLEQAAGQLGEFVGALHRPAPADAPRNPYRGVLLSERHAVTLERVRQLADLVDASRVLDLWTHVSGAPPWPGPPLWIHGDLHPANVLVSGGCVSAVIDFGDLCAGDPATDLSIAWMMFPAAVRRLFRLTARPGDRPVDEDTWARARAWALTLALAYLAHSADNAILGTIGRRTLSAVLADES